MSKSPASVLLLGILLAMAPFSALANDSFAGLRNGGLVSGRTEAVAMRREVLTISPGRISVTYEFVNRSARTVSGVVAFPIEVRCGWFEFPTDYPDRFETTVDGRKVRTRTEVRALVRSDAEQGWYAEQAQRPPGTDVTAALRAARLPLDCRQAPRGSAAYRRLARMNLAQAVPEDEPWWVYFLSRISHYWTQRFPAGRTLRITHAYTPSLGGGSSGAWRYPAVEAQIPRYLDFYRSQPALAPLTADFQQSGAYTAVEYVLTTANSWAGPIGRFELVIPKPQGVVVTSLPGALSFRDGDLVIRLGAFEPKDELTVVFYGKAPSH